MHLLAGLTPKDWIGPVLTALAAMAAVFTTWRLNRNEARARVRHDYLRTQLEWLYGPLAFLTTANRYLFERFEKTRALSETALGAESQTAWHDSDALEHHTKDVATIMDIEKAYMAKVGTNNRAIAKLIRAKYHLLDFEDQEMCHRFVHQVDRRAVEQHHDKRFLRGRAEPIIAVDHRFFDDVELSYTRKKDALHELLEFKVD